MGAASNLLPDPIYARFGQSSKNGSLSGLDALSVARVSVQMGMSSHPTRFPDATWEMACEEAQHLGIPVALFIREAVVARIAVARERRLAPDANMETVFRAAARRLDREASAVE